MFHLLETGPYLHFQKAVKFSSAFRKVVTTWIPLTAITVRDTSAFVDSLRKQDAFSCSRTQEDNNETVTSRYSDVFSHERFNSHKFIASAYFYVGGGKT